MSQSYDGACIVIFCLTQIDIVYLHFINIFAFSLKLYCFDSSSSPKSQRINRTHTCNTGTTDFKGKVTGLCL